MCVMCYSKNIKAVLFKHGTVIIQYLHGQASHMIYGGWEWEIGKGHVDSLHVCRVGILKGDDWEIKSREPRL